MLEISAHWCEICRTTAIGPWDVFANATKNSQIDRDRTYCCARGPLCACGDRHSNTQTGRRKQSGSPDIFFHNGGVLDCASHVHHQMDVKAGQQLT